MRLLGLAASLILSATLAFAREVQVSLTDLATGHCVDAARIEWDGDTIKNQSATTNDAGLATITVPDGEQWINLSAAKPGLVKVRFRDRVPTSQPAEIRLVTEPGVRISGRVIDDAGHGVAAAHLITYVSKKYPGYNQSVSVPDPITDADGKWFIDGVPAKCDRISQVAWSHLCLPDHGYYNEKPYEPQSQLYDGTATLTLNPGTRIEGTVRSGDGQPLEGAKIYYDADRYVSNAFPPARTDAAGQFVLGIAPGVTAKLLIEHAGFGPAMQIVPVGTAAQTVAVTLPPPSVLSGRVVDRAGKGVAGASVRVRDWKGRDTLGETLTSDADGHFSWSDAPADPVKAEITAAGFAYQTGVELLAGKQNEVRLTTPTNVSVAVVDATSGEPIKDYVIRQGIVWSAGQRVVWQGDRLNSEAKRDEHGFHFTNEYPADHIVIRVEAAGHFAAETPQFVPDGDDKNFTLKLERGTPYEATVKMADGSSAGTGRAYFVDDYMLVNNGNAPEFQELQPAIAADGKFALPPMREKGLLVVMTDRGAGRWKVGEWESQHDLTIQPWTTISGRIMVGNKPLANASLDGSQFEEPNGGLPLVRWMYSVNTDANGQFRLDHVWPGELKLLQYVSNRSPGRMWGQMLGTIDAKAGQAMKVQVGGHGHPVVGRLDMASFGGKPWMVRVAEVVRADQPAGPALTPRIEDDGQFRVAGVAGGEYTLKILLHEWPPNDACGWGRMLGEYTARFTVPAVADDGYNDQPVDIGTIASAALPTDVLKIGDVAPAFEFKTLEGQPIKLADHRGKFVLLDFWATWCAPCVAEVPNMKALRAKHADDPRLAIIGMSEDETPESAKYFVREEKIDWPQVLLGTESPTATQYGATAIPQTVLIDPDGKVIATGLRGDDLSKAIDAALAKR